MVWGEERATVEDFLNFVDGAVVLEHVRVVLDLKLLIVVEELCCFLEGRSGWWWGFGSFGVHCRGGWIILGRVSTIMESLSIWWTNLVEELG